MSAAERTCECGCGAPVAKRFVQGHAARMDYVKRAAAEARSRVDMEARRGTRRRNEEIRARMSRGESQTDLAIEYGISPQRCEQIYRKGRYLARAAVASALARGVLIRPDRCSRCPSSGPLESHHPDYSRPLEVVWLCRLCHRAADKERRRAKGEARRYGTGPRRRAVQSIAEAKKRRQAQARAERQRKKEREREMLSTRLLLDLAEVALAVGHTPTIPELNERLPYTHPIFYTVFGSLRQAQHLAGLVPNGVGARGRHARDPLPPNFRQVVEGLRDELRCAA